MYQLIKEEYIKELHTKSKLYMHVKSGARVLTLENDDENKVFTIGFRTPPINSTGVPHILEHSTLCGSKKFPVKDPFIELAKGSLNTFLNAMTFSDKTLYPVASLNLKDFKNLMEVYLDAVFYPNVYKYEEIFKQEGWHYELLNKDDEIKYNGIVYNEMKGAYSNPDRIIYQEIFKSLFPDTTYGVESGGDPMDIPKLSYEEFLNFHKKYYSPKNSYIVLYGKMDMNERLEYLENEYLNNFDIVEVDSKINYQEPFTKPKAFEIEYPVSKDASIKDKNYYAYSVAIKDFKNNKVINALNIISYCLLDMPGAPLKQALLDKKIGKDISSMFDDSLMQPVFSIISKESKDDSMDEFINIIDKKIKEIIKNGIDKKSLYSAINIIEFKLREGDYGRAPKGLLYTIMAFGTWLYDDNMPVDRLYYEDELNDLKAKVETDYYEKILEEYILLNNHKTYITGVPSTTLLTENENKVKDELKKYKESLSDEELDELIANTNKLKKYQETPSTKEELDTIPTLKREDVKDQDFKYFNTEEKYQDIKIIKHDIETNGIGYLSLMFDASKINKDYIPYLGLLVSILGSVDTKKYKYQDLTNEIYLHTGGLNLSFISYKVLDDSRPFITFDSKYLYGNEKFVIDTVLEIIKNSSFSDLNRLNEIVMENKIDLESDMIGSGHSQSITRALSYINKDSYYKDNVSGIGEYLFIKDLEKNFDLKINDTILILKELIKTIFRKENLIISYTGKKDEFKSYLDELLNNLYTDEVVINKFDFVADIKNEGFKTPSQVQYVSKVGLFDKSLYNGAIQAFLQSLSYDYLYIKIRVLGGAYGAMSNVNRDGIVYFSSYRDPKLKETLDIYNEVPKFIDELVLSDETITKYIIGAIGYIDMPLSPKQAGDISMSAYIRNTNIDDIKKEREELLNASLEDFKKYKDAYIKMLDSNIICVIGNENIIDKNKELFKNIITLVD